MQPTEFVYTQCKKICLDTGLGSADSQAIACQILELYKTGKKKPKDIWPLCAEMAKKAFKQTK